MLLSEKHQIALDDSSFLEQQKNIMLQKIQQDNTGSCWHISSLIPKVEEEYAKLIKLNYQEKKSLPFFGLTVGVKDLFCVQNTLTTAGSKILENFISPYDSHVWKTLAQKGSLFGGKLAMDEFAMGSFSNTSFLGRVSIPNYPDHTAGGSSGGSAAALAQGIFDFTIGSDTGGSVRLPASFCSVVGYKPSYGSFSRYGMISYASSLDQAGFFTKNLQDLQYILKQNIALEKSLDPTHNGLSTYYVESKKSFKIGFFPHLFQEQGIQENIKKSYEKTIQTLQSQNVELIPIDIPLMKEAAQIYYIIACSEASSNLARYQGIYFGKPLIEEKNKGTFWEQIAQYRGQYFGKEVKKRIMLGSFILSSENFDAMYKKALLLRDSLTANLENVLKKVDLLILPVSPMTSPKWQDIQHMSDSQIYMSDYLTVPFSLAGLPAISTPDFKDENGLGIGIQWVGQKMKDYQLLHDIMQLKEIK